MGLRAPRRTRGPRRAGGGIARRSDLPTKVREAIRLIELNGWQLVATRGSHRQYKHPTKTGRVTVPGKLSDDLAPGTLASILKQAGVNKDGD